MTTARSPVLLALVAMLIIGGLQYVALVHGVDDWRAAIAIPAIAGLGGYTLRHVIGLMAPGGRK